MIGQTPVVFESQPVITLFKSIAVFSGTDGCLWNVPLIECGNNWGLFRGIFFVPYNIVVGLNNVMVTCCDLSVFFLLV